MFFSNNYLYKAIAVLIIIISVLLATIISVALGAVVTAVTIVPAYIYNFYRTYKIFSYWKGKSFDKKKS